MKESQASTKALEWAYVEVQKNVSPKQKLLPNSSPFTASRAGCINKVISWILRANHLNLLNIRSQSIMKKVFQ